ncbi:YicC/YloC family endoribonuclease [Brevibacillus sp. NRS-1366]|uniref:YicC/YloC family endoribonuclease n=1 Tax=Brevibacillus sp. NRS-1366 TaxID=3233899 RepID=UPI003D1A93BA
MIRSMTGYGRIDEVKGSTRLTVEIRSVNHRFSEILVRLPKAWSILEDPVRKLIAQFTLRGRVEVSISLENIQSISAASINWSVAEQYVALTREIDRRFLLETVVTAKDVLFFPGVLHTKETEAANDDELVDWLLAQVQVAAKDLLSMKVAEGRQLYADLTKRLSHVSEWIKEIHQLAPLGMEEYHSRLQQRLNEWTHQAPFELDMGRVAQEVAFFADKSDISEEITRLESHCHQFVEQFGKDEAIGRKLDFLLQEMNREANTIASKANHLRIQHLAVEIKSELEKMREQVQNVE